LAFFTFRPFSFFYSIASNKLLTNDSLDNALIAQAITLPSESYLAEFLEPIDPIAIHQVRRFMRETIALHLKDDLLTLYHRLTDDGAYRIDQHSIQRRRLKNTGLSYLMELNQPEIRQLCWKQFDQSDNITDVIAALKPLANTDCAEREAALNRFYQQWKNEPLVVDKWLTIQAGSRLPDTLKQVKQPTQHAAFQIKNPNKVRALIGSFAQNQAQFHQPNLFFSPFMNFN
jgi:aminopeptidase N